MKKKLKVVMLPTENPKVGDKVLCHREPSKYIFEEIIEEIGNGYISTDGGVRNPTLKTLKHLYILSDEEIKEGDWLVQSPTGLVLQDTTGDNNWGASKKIIATTDKALHYLQITITNTESDWEPNIPQIPDTFLKQYVEAGGIDEVELEYEITEDIIKHPFQTGGIISHRYSKLKLTNNEVILLPIEEKMYSREEVEELLNDFSTELQVRGFGTRMEREWIEKNL